MTEERLVTLVKNHTHEGVQHYAGETIPLPVEDAEWLAKAVGESRTETAALAANVPGTPENAAASIGKGKRGI